MNKENQAETESKKVTVHTVAIEDVDEAEGEVGQSKEVSLPEVFSTPYRPDLINRAVATSQSNRKQPDGIDMRSGKRTSAESWGAGRGEAMVPRISGGNRAALVPQTVGGRRAHPPKSTKDHSKKLNKKERKLALKSAISSSCNVQIVRERGHLFEDLPIVVDDGIHELNKTKHVKNLLEDVGVWEDVQKAKKAFKDRGRAPKSVLIIYSKDNGISLGARNLPGVETLDVENLNIEMLAPGGDAGRLTVWSKSAIEKIEEAF